MNPIESESIYALFDPHGKMCSCSHRFDDITRFLPSTVRYPSFSSEMWNALFSSSDEMERKKIFESQGWKLMRGSFTPTEGEEV